jgi:hypothetical protein
MLDCNVVLLFFVLAKNYDLQTDIACTTDEHHASTLTWDCCCKSLRGLTNVFLHHEEIHMTLRLANMRRYAISLW